MKKTPKVPAPRTWHVGIVGQQQDGARGYQSFHPTDFVFLVYVGTDEPRARALKTTLAGLGLDMQLTYRDD